MMSNKINRWLGLALALLMLLPMAVAGQDSAPPNPLDSANGPLSQSPAAKIAPELLATLSGGRSASFFVLLQEQADLSGASALPTKQEKGRYVFEQLRQTAQRTQAGLLAELADRNAPHRAFYVVNAVLVTGDEALALELAAHPEVARLTANPTVQQVMEPEFTPEEGAPQAIEWGVLDVNADEVWSTYQVTGAGIVVAGEDTGIRWDHAALQDHYRGVGNGAPTDHNYHWWDAIHEDIGPPGANPCGYSSPTPCDDHNHGTHTIGTIIGDDGGSNQIGVAPGAEFIGCRNMDNGFGQPSTYAECFEFFLAPWDLNGENPDPGKAPDISSNSWSCPPGEGCNPDTWGVLQVAMQNLRAAGVLVVFSAGNNGSSCGSISDPPALFDEAFAVGAYSSSHNIAAFSSRGPRYYTDLQGPDVSAPGVSVRSALKSGGYGSMSGTSMAAPHVAGVAALLWSAAPGLVGHVEATEQYLRETANYDVSNLACGSGENSKPWNTWDNVYGWGRIDALAAVEAALCPADVDYDRRVTILDAILVAQQWGLSLGDEGYNPRRDLNFDDTISIQDILAVIAAWPGAC